jgi:AraC-like DNA-binding protein
VNYLQDIGQFSIRRGAARRKCATGALSYLTAWRMHVAAGLLLEVTGNIGTVAGRVGYRSEAAFSIAFKRWAGISPSGYRYDASC